MLTKVEVLNIQGQVLELPMFDSSDGYLIKEIEGLDPVRATISSSPFGQLDGSQYHASRRENRNIVMKLGLEPDFATETVQELRARLYAFLMPKSFVTLRFFLDDLYFAEITGRVETLEAPLFTKEPEATTSILCFDPDFTTTGGVQYTGFTVTDATEQLIAYPGTTDTGFILKLLIDRDLSAFTIFNRPTGGAYQSLEFSALLSAGDELEISTVSGAKHALLTRNNSQRSILYGVSPDSDWVNLHPGENLFRVVAEGAPVPFTIEYVAKYGGL